ncbi:MAG: single-stranded-DNA-specific exonuclease RecJ [Sulfuricurvum sp.]|jgi:single-stranded-DNA-specific exonuclease|uniref:single-stranded-DNA-specific exonuclease RecJ n=1 Tax=Sulfuricurvum sp. TaxID=2025608 RepID=UPI0025CF58B2|nr:single-stranded-DNA-specific exonuclease RecJ [Sulfuricurvum sp.]MCK9372015.1 single-stranded-DNA-specific exonuclease RecJ [Sulfuricurvum sp.]
MLILPEVPLLTHETLSECLARRFDAQSEKLSEIPHPTLLKDSQKAADRIVQAIRRGEKIALVGDYDVDGVTSTAIVKRFFDLIPYPLTTTIPNRFTDGYGVSRGVLERLDADVVFTVDNGINAFQAAEVCKERGIDLIITDHHTPSETLPDAYAIVNPKQHDCPYPFKEICGAQVGWLLLGLIKKELGLNVDMRRFFPFLALAIIADVMPLIGLNRGIVKSGLQMMQTSSLAPFVIIRDFLGRSAISSEDIAFQIAPRINSAGRLEDASIALDFLTADTTARAYHQFELLTSLNTLRKETEAQTTAEAMIRVNAEDAILIVEAQGWNEGVVGIVASRLVNHFQKPAVVLSVHNGIAKGSGRSIGNVDLYSLIKSQEHLLEKFGGHKMAAGLSLNVKNIQAFRTGVNAEAAKLHPDDFIPQSDILGELEHHAINFDLLSLLERYEPYGEGNPRPRFLIRDAEVVSVKLFGSDRSHSRIELRPLTAHPKTLELIAFRRVVECPKNRPLSCSYTVNKNEFNGRVSLQLMIERLF